jgi:hypothetical protein
MDYRSRDKFQSRFRELVEREPLSVAEIMLEEVASTLADPTLDRLFSVAPEDVYITAWPTIAAAMRNVRDGVPEKRGAMILSLVHRNWDSDDMRIEVSFADDAEAEVFREGHSRSLLTNETEYERWKADAQNLGRLPPRPHWPSGGAHLAPRLVGLGDARLVQDRPLGEGPELEERRGRWNYAKYIAASLVFLRFCQTAQRHLSHDTAQPRLPTFLTVALAEWPMETGTVDYCEAAVRLIRA